MAVPTGNDRHSNCGSVVEPNDAKIFAIVDKVKAANVDVKCNALLSRNTGWGIALVGLSAPVALGGAAVVRQRSGRAEPPDHS